MRRLASSPPIARKASDRSALVGAWRYIAGVLARMQEVWVGRQIAEMKSKLQRMSPVDDNEEYHELFGDLVAMEAYRRSLLAQAVGDDVSA